MGLKKEINVNNSGFTADYCNIEVFQYDKTRETDKQIVVRMAVYKSKEDRENGMNQITGFEVLFNDSEFKDAIIGKVYEKVKTMKEFEGAEDA